MKLSLFHWTMAICLLTAALGSAATPTYAASCGTFFFLKRKSAKQ